MKNYKIYLIRHGSTEANEKGLYCGRGLDIPLSPDGTNGLNRLLDTGIYPYVDELYTSPMQRSIETANILYPGQPQIIMDGLAEAAFGPFEGRSLDELKHDPVYQKWVAPTSKFTPLGVEPSADFFSRDIESIVKIIEHMADTATFSAAVVTHASVIGNILSGLCLPKRAPYDWPTEPGCGYLIETNAMLWMQSAVFEVTRELPLLPEEELPEESDDEYGGLEY